MEKLQFKDLMLETQFKEGQTLICVNGGRIEIISGASAHSAEAKKGNHFKITHIDKYHVYGELITSPGMGFKHEPGLSGKTISDKDKYHSGKGIVYAILLENINKGKTDDFWATWKVK